MARLPDYPVTATIDATTFTVFVKDGTTYRVPVSQVLGVHTSQYNHTSYATKTDATSAANAARSAHEGAYDHSSFITLSDASAVVAGHEQNYDHSEFLTAATLPPLAITSVFTVADMTERDALNDGTSIQEGDVVRVLDDGTGNLVTQIFDGSVFFELTAAPGASFDQELNTFNDATFSEILLTGPKANIIHTTTLTSSIGIGYEALRDNSGYSNIAVGDIAMQKNKNGTRNVAVGDSAMYSSRSGADNIAIGSAALAGLDNTNDRSKNIAIGSNALTLANFAEENVAIGHNSMYAVSGSIGNTAIGTEALHFCANGDLNTAVGYWALYDTSVGMFNTAIGAESLKGVYGSYNVALGYKAGYGQDGTGKLWIGVDNTNLITGDFFGGTLMLNADTTINGKLIGTKLTGVTETVKNISASGTINIDFIGGNTQIITLSGDATIHAPNFFGSSDGSTTVSIVLLIDCNNFSVSWGSTPTIKWLTVSNEAPTFNQTAGKINAVTLMGDSKGSRWLGFFAGREE